MPVDAVIKEYSFREGLGIEAWGSRPMNNSAPASPPHWLSKARFQRLEPGKGRQPTLMSVNRSRRKIRGSHGLTPISDPRSAPRTDTADRSGPLSPPGAAFTGDGSLDPEKNPTPPPSATLESFPGT